MGFYSMKKKIYSHGKCDPKSEPCCPIRICLLGIQLAIALPDLEKHSHGRVTTEFHPDESDGL